MQSTHLAVMGVVGQVQCLQHLALLLVGEVAQQGLQATPQELVCDLLGLQRLVKLRRPNKCLVSNLSLNCQDSGRAALLAWHAFQEGASNTGNNQAAERPTE